MFTRLVTAAEVNGDKEGGRSQKCSVEPQQKALTADCSLFLDDVPHPRAQGRLVPGGVSRAWSCGHTPDVSRVSSGDVTGRRGTPLFGAHGQQGLPVLGHSLRLAKRAIPSVLSPNTRADLAVIQPRDRHFSRGRGACELLLLTPGLGWSTKNSEDRSPCVEVFIRGGR